ncbi:MAG: PrsW family intramembrane metalloprotease [Candidatus Taylorbacteria bacterium]|nr:PrsW family intramembrane metalloprotease [Candidatus Taylorbacteria bacterium]
MNTTSFIYAALAGIIPSFLWLYFWLREDRLHPEPKILIFIAFVGGMIAVPLVLPLEQFVNNHFTGALTIFGLWALIEEFMKYLAGFILVLRKSEDDEPLDPIIYMITIALGFSALENTFFILKPVLAGDAIHAIVTTDLRFIGATLLHVVCSAIIGASIALTFYKSKAVKRVGLFIGIILATTIHTSFNYFVMQGTGNDALMIFFYIWIAAIILMLVIERVKTLYTPTEQPNM